MGNYLQVNSDYNNIYVTEIMNDNTIISKTIKNYQPELFTNTHNETGWHTLIGNDPVRKIKFESMKRYHEYKKEMKGVNGVSIYNNIDPAYQYIRETFSYDLPIMFPNIWYFDIETDLYEDKFSDPRKALAPITLLQVYDKHNDDFLILSHNREYETKSDNVKYFNCGSEIEMLSKWVELMYERNVTLVTAWFGDNFDFPYVINRMEVLGMDPKILSRFEKLENHTTVIYGQKESIKKPMGVYWIDAVEAYRKVAFGGRESWSLDFIAKYEGIEGKLSYTSEGFKSMSDFIRGKYDPEYDKVKGKLYQLYQEGKQDTPQFRRIVSDMFVDYGIEDVRILKELDEELNMSGVLFALQWKMRVNLYDVFGTVKPWATLIYNKLYDRKQVLPDDSKKKESRSYGGGYVFAKPGKYEWVISEDATSLYPSIMRIFNTSPETYIPKEKLPPELKQFYDKLCANPKAEEVIMGFNDKQKEMLSNKLKEYNVCMSVNGTFYTKEKQGIIPELVTGFFNQRKAHKKKMIEADQMISKIKDELARRK